PRRAAFLDRDGTIIRDAVYVRDPKDVELLPGAAAAIARLNARGIVVIVVTNQSGIARGLLTKADYERVRVRTHELVAAEGGRIEATYMCPHYPETTGACDCRKPGLAMYKQAIAEHDLDPARSVFIGDRWRDVAPAAAFGGRGILLDVESTPREDRERAQRESIETARSLSDAVDGFLSMLPAPELSQ
ncbi:MAG: D-glycero-alpha-D-manno-heptose-1,7-bisphosphate 7-phosphatase, partial [Solirubrobacteraceae bacterium]